MLHNLSADHLVCAGPPGPALSVEEPKAFDNCDRPTRASAAVQGARPGDPPTINAGSRLGEKYAALRFSVQRRTSVRRAVSRRYCTHAPPPPLPMLPKRRTKGICGRGFFGVCEIQT